MATVFHRCTDEATGEILNIGIDTLSDGVRLNLMGAHGVSPVSVKLDFYGGQLTLRYWEDSDTDESVVIVIASTPNQLRDLINGVNRT